TPCRTGRPTTSPGASPCASIPWSARSATSPAAPPHASAQERPSRPSSGFLGRLAPGGLCAVFAEGARARAHLAEEVHERVGQCLLPQAVVDVLSTLLPPHQARI